MCSGSAGSLYFFRMRDENFITIPFGLRRRLDITPSELLIVALIYGFSQDGDTWFSGSAEYIAQWVGINRRNVFERLKSLTERGILIKSADHGNGGQRRCMYKFNFTVLDNSDETSHAFTSDETSPRVVMKHHQGGDETSPRVVMKHHPDNIDNNIDNNIEDNRESTHARENDDNLLFDDGTINAAAVAEKEKRKKKKESASLKLFRESETAGLVTYSGGVPDASRLYAEFSAEKYKGVDLLYYYETVADWSDSANKKRTARGWLATIRQFIEGDREKGKLRLLEGADFNWDAAMDYLKMGRI